MKTIIALLLCAVCAGAAFAQVPNDVPKDHWAYQAVEELANKGYVLGYEDGDFLGERTLTRYEFATIVSRILNDLDSRIAAVENLPAVTVTNPKPVVVESAATAGVSPEDLAAVNKLVDEFKVELTIIGTRLDKVERNLDTLQAQVGNIDAAVFDPEGVVQETKDNVDKLKKVSVGGYVQARYQTMDFNKEDKSETSQYDTFLVRRARVKVKAQPTSRLAGVVQLDAAKNSVAVKDAYLQYALGESLSVAPSFAAGQQNWWFGYEVPYSSSKRETPERALFIRRFFPGEEDTGLVFFGSPGNNSFSWTAGIYNGTGIELGKASATDKNDAKDYLLHLKWGLGDMDLGVSGYWGKGTWAADEVAYNKDIDKIRYGADLQYYMNNLTFKGEWVRGKGFDYVDAGPIQNEWINGYYAQVDYNLDPADILVARYSSMSQDPKAPALGERTAWDLGYIRWLDDKTRFKLFYRINKEENNAIDDNDGWLAEWIMTY